MDYGMNALPPPAVIQYVILGLHTYSSLSYPFYNSLSSLHMPNVAKLISS